MHGVNMCVQMYTMGRCRWHLNSIIKHLYRVFFLGRDYAISPISPLKLKISKQFFNKSYFYFCVAHRKNILKTLKLIKVVHQENLIFFLKVNNTKAATFVIALPMHLSTISTVKK